jgi:predicted ATPase
MISTIKFKNYKPFKSLQILDLKPITILIGKNSSGKSAVLKLPSLIENSLSGSFQEPLLLSNNGIEHGGEFKDLVYSRQYAGLLEISLENDIEQLNIVIGSNQSSNNLEIFSWKLDDFEIDTSKEIFSGFLATSKKIQTLSLNINYISSCRDGLERYFGKDSKTYDAVGIKGEYVYSILIEDGLTTPQNIIKQVSKFYHENFEGWGIRFNKDLVTPPYQIELESGNLRINLKEVGLGMIHALPLVVTALMPAKQETLIVIEEPELHLHPAAHGNLAQLFADSLSDTNKRYLIETHSQNFVLRLRRLIAQGDLDKEKVVIYYADFDEKTAESTLTRIDIDEQGKPINHKTGEIYWPENVFSETLDETRAIRTAQLTKQNHDH